MREGGSTGPGMSPRPAQAGLPSGEPGSNREELPTLLDMFSSWLPKRPFLRLSTSSFLVVLVGSSSFTLSLHVFPEVVSLAIFSFYSLYTTYSSCVTLTILRASTTL